MFFYRKNSQKFGEKYKKGLPLEVVPMAYVPITRKIEDNLGGSAILRMAVAKAVSYSLIHCNVLL